MNLFRVSAAFVLAAGIALTSATVQAGENISPERLVYLSREYKLFDRPDLLNFDPFHPTGTFEGSTESFQFTSMGVDYTTSVASYSDYGFDCFSDPDPDKMLDENFLCVRAGHRRPNFLVYAASYAAFIVYEYLSYNSYGPAGYYFLNGIPQGPYTAFIEGLFGSEVYVAGYFHVMTADGGELFAEYQAEIPDKLIRKDTKIKFRQSAFLDFGAFVVDESEGFDAGFYSWFEGCEIKTKVKGEPAAVQGPMWPPNKQGVLEKVKSKLDCDKDAVDVMEMKLQADAGDNASAATSIFRAALAKLGSDKKLKLKVKDNDGTEIVDDDDIVMAR